MTNVVSSHCQKVYVKFAKRVDPKLSHHKGKKTCNYRKMVTVSQCMCVKSLFCPI